jgi:hypothetical protein
MVRWTVQIKLSDRSCRFHVILDLFFLLTKREVVKIIEFGVDQHRNVQVKCLIFGAFWSCRVFRGRSSFHHSLNKRGENLIPFLSFDSLSVSPTITFTVKCRKLLCVWHDVSLPNNLSKVESWEGTETGHPGPLNQGRKDYPAHWMNSELFLTGYWVVHKVVNSLTQLSLKPHSMRQSRRRKLAVWSGIIWCQIALDSLLGCS